MNAPSSLKKLTAGLSQDEQQEMYDLLSYISEKLDNNMGQSPEGGIGQILNGASPKVRERFAMLNQFIETPRSMPFDEKRSEGQNIEALGLDSQNGQLVKNALDGQEVMGKLQQRMGVDKPDKRPPTRREQVAAALEASLPKE